MPSTQASIQLILVQDSLAVLSDLPLVERMGVLTLQAARCCWCCCANSGQRNWQRALVIAHTAS
ncbi:hypothetical protein BD289DRAFT_439766 [Coniella lustricola]|uniref:Uncharacterized protein n=1 Tax=Coniella lustricola TaxID=2025994 RepID=A0A2T3A1D6_9PEZI|nr:hypothetical protein BD289DRAFT_439766 [Coniella lustricola]